MKETHDIRTLIQHEMRAAFPAAEERVAQFYGMQEYHLGWRDTQLNPASSDPGKLIRPQMALLACQMVGGDVAHAMPLAAGIQLIHDFSLIHDDIEDDSDTRRGRITVWKQWGLAHGINVGDGMFVVSHMSLHRMADVGVDATRALDILRRFDRTILTICEGQYLDMSFEGNLTITEDDYLTMISRKTAALIACAAELGGLVGNATPESVHALADYGEYLGLSFQIQDDVIGIWGEPAITGKPRAADIYRRKVSLPIVHALRNAPNATDLDRVYRQNDVSDNDVDAVLAVLEAANSRAYTEAMAVEYHHKAVAALNAVQCGSSDAAQQAFEKVRALTEALLGRQS